MFLLFGAGALCGIGPLPKGVAPIHEWIFGVVFLWGNPFLHHFETPPFVAKSRGTADGKGIFITARVARCSKHAPQPFSKTVLGTPDALGQNGLVLCTASLLHAKGTWNLACDLCLALNAAKELKLQSNYK